MFTRGVYVECVCVEGGFLFVTTFIENSVIVLYGFIIASHNRHNSVGHDECSYATTPCSQCVFYFEKVFRSISIVGRVNFVINFMKRWPIYRSSKCLKVSNVRRKFAV